MNKTDLAVYFISLAIAACAIAALMAAAGIIG